MMYFECFVVLLVFVVGVLFDVVEVFVCFVVM